MMMIEWNECNAYQRVDLRLVSHQFHGQVVKIVPVLFDPDSRTGTATIESSHNLIRSLESRNEGNRH